MLKSVWICYIHNRFLNGQYFVVEDYLRVATLHIHALIQQFLLNRKCNFLLLDILWRHCNFYYLSQLCSTKYLETNIHVWYLPGTSLLVHINFVVIGSLDIQRLEIK